MATRRSKIKTKTEHKHDSISQAITWNRYLGSNEYKQRRITWGKHTNWMIKDLPIDYLKWLILNTENLIWADWFARELQSRDSNYKDIQSKDRKTRNDFFKD